MKNYRIKRVSDRDGTKYYPQRKFFGLFWVNAFEHPEYGGRYYYTFEEAQKTVCDYLRGPVVEYLSVDCGESV